MHHKQSTHRATNRSYSDHSSKHDKSSFNRGERKARYSSDSSASSNQSPSPPSYARHYRHRTLHGQHKYKSSKLQYEETRGVDRKRHAGANTMRSSSPFHARYQSSRRSRRMNSDKHRRSPSDSPYDEPQEQVYKTTVVVLRNIPLNVDEQFLEDLVRSIAISLRFSPPNLVRCFFFGQEKIALIEFPSTDSTETFLETCSRNFEIKNKPIKIMRTLLPLGALALIISTSAEVYWDSVIEKVSISGQAELKSARLPTRDASQAPPTKFICPNFDQFQLDRNSNLLYNDAYDLYLDPHTQQYFSGEGIYYAKISLADHADLVPIYRLALTMTEGGTHPAKVARSNDDTGGQKFDVTTVDEENNKTPKCSSSNPDSTNTTATAVASILASAQLAAEATIKVVKATAKTSTLPSGNAEGLKGSKSSESFSKIQTETPSMMTLFTCGDDDNTFDEQSEIQPALEQQEDHQAKNTNNPPAWSATNNSETDIICYICLRQFPSLKFLKDHESLSAFHKRNLIAQNVDLTLPQSS